MRKVMLEMPLVSKDHACKEGKFLRAYPGAFARLCSCRPADHPCRGVTSEMPVRNSHY